jgi:hypothetical protein
MSGRSVVSPSRHITPSEFQSQLDQLLQDLEKLRAWLQNRVEGGLVAAPTSASTQASGVGNTTWRCNVAALLATVDGVIAELVVQADVVIHSGSFLTSFADGYACVAAVVLKNVTGTISLATVKGTVAAWGSQVAPSDAVIQAAVGAGNEWLKLGETTLRRTADTAVVQSYNNLVRAWPVVVTDTSLGDWSSFT